MEKADAEIAPVIISSYGDIFGEAETQTAENIDILVGGSVVAFGEIVIIEATMGVRITDFNTEE